MTQFLAWLIAVEILGVAFLPLTMWLLRWLPDRGYVFAKILGLLAVTYLTWIIGSFVPVAGGPALPLAALLLAGGFGWWRWRAQTIDALREIARVAALEELLFVGALLAWSMLRAQAFGPSIAHTEQFMDVMYLNVSFRATSYPPIDAWMSGHTVNYYYFGYLMFATLLKLSGVTAAVGYNLSLSSIFAFTVAGSYSLGYALIRRLVWPLLAPLFVALLGNWHAFLWQVPHSGCPGNSPTGAFWGWLFDSTRVIGGHYTLSDWSCGHGAALKTIDYTINEFPLFSLVLGDLHPHVIALPVALLAVAAGCAILFAPSGLIVDRRPESVARLLIIAGIVGSLFTINSWDFPTYLLVVSVCLAVKAYIADPSPSWWKMPLASVVALGAGSVVLFVPFYLHFRTLSHGIGTVTTPTDPYEFLQVLGFPVLVCVLLVGTLNLLLRPAEEVEEAEETEMEVGRREGLAASLTKGGEAGSSTLALALTLAGVVLLGGVLHRWALLLLLAFGLWAAMILIRVINTEQPNLSDATSFVLICVAALLLVITELYYVRDSFDGSGLYRMNTVFKFYYHAWVLLGLAGAYGVYRAWHVLGKYFGRWYAWAAMAIVAAGALGAGIATRYVASYAVAPSSTGSLDGMVWLKQSQPSDYAAIQWMRSNVKGNPVQLEAEGPDYLVQGPYGRVSAFTGLPTVMGWAGHEVQWRPGNSEVGARQHDVCTLFATADPRITKRLLHRYDVRYVFVGTQERQPCESKSPNLAKFARFMQIAYRSGSTTVYTW